MIGVGAVGTALAARLAAAGWRAGALVASRRASARRAARRAGCGVPSTDPVAAARGARWVFLCVPDGAVRPLVARIARGGGFGPASRVVHTSGASGRGLLAAAARAGARTAALHPMLPFPSREFPPDMKGAFWAVDAAPSFYPEAARLVRLLGGVPGRVPPARRALYHAAGVFAANHLVVQVALARDLLVRAGIPRRRALAALLPLARGAVDALARAGLPGAITGPAARGEADVLRRHRRALAAAGGDCEAIYRLLARAALRLGVAKGTARSDAARRVAAALSAHP